MLFAVVGVFVLIIVADTVIFAVFEIVLLISGLGESELETDTELVPVGVLELVTVLV